MIIWLSSESYPPVFYKPDFGQKWVRVWLVPTQPYTLMARYHGVKLTQTLTLTILNIYFRLVKIQGGRIPKRAGNFISKEPILNKKCSICQMFSFSSLLMQDSIIYQAINIPMLHDVLPVQRN